MRPLERRKVGTTDLELPVLGAGTAPLGNLFVRVSGAESQAILQAAWDAGIRYFDTSPYYGHGKSEHRLGHFLQERRRSDFAISTKVGRVFTRFHGDPEDFHDDRWAEPLPFDLRFDYTYDGVLRSYEDSTHRLGLNRIDLLVIHDLDSWFHKTEEAMDAKLKELESGWKALEQLRSSGEIRGIGAGANEEGVMLRMLENFDIDFFLVAMPYTLLDQDTLDKQFPACKQRGVSIIIGAPYVSGILATGPTADAMYKYQPASEQVKARVQAMQEVCDRCDVSLRSAALQFPLGHPIVTSVIPGALQPQHVRDSVAAMQAPIPPDFWSQLKESRLIREDAPMPGS